MKETRAQRDDASEIIRARIAEAGGSLSVQSDEPGKWVVEFDLGLDTEPSEASNDFFSLWAIILAADMADASDTDHMQVAGSVLWSPSREAYIVRCDVSYVH